jgi:HSP20 family protein
VREDGGGVVLRERRLGAFRREFALPERVTAEQVTASYDRGVLEVRLSGAAARRRSTRIPVATGARRPEAEPVQSGESSPEPEPVAATRE